MLMKFCNNYQKIQGRMALKLYGETLLVRVLKNRSVL